ncbi:MAG: HlyD family efflux transporter periplasmic adaptor subunit [Actinoplanes sp.]
MAQSTATTPPSSTPAAAATPPVAPKRRTSLRKWWARLFVLLLVAAAVLLYLRISGDRATDATHIGIGRVTLTAQTVPVETALPGQVTAVSVTPQQRVSAGQRLGTVQVTSTDAQGEPVLSTTVLRAPRAGVVIDEPVTVGSTLQPGQPFVRLYDPTRLMFIAEVPIEKLTAVSAGMDVALKAEGIRDTVRATVERIVPHVADASAEEVAAGSLRTILVPAEGQDTSGLIPGMRFTGVVDILTGPPGSPRLVPGG